MRCASFGVRTSPSALEACIKVSDCVTRVHLSPAALPEGERPFPPLVLTDRPLASFYTGGINCYSLPTKLRLALLHERPDSLLCLLAAEQRLHQLAFDLQPLRQRHVHAPVHGKLYGTYRPHGAGGQPLRVPQRLFLQPIGREQPVENT